MRKTLNEQTRMRKTLNKQKRMRETLNEQTRIRETLNEQTRTGGQMPYRKNHCSLSVGSESFTTIPVSFVFLLLEYLNSFIECTIFDHSKPRSSPPREPVIL